MESVGGDLVVRYDPAHAGWVILDYASGELVEGPFSVIDQALGFAHSFATKNNVRLRPDAKYKRGPRSNQQPSR